MFLQDAVYCLSFAHDGTRFASGGADKSVIIWGANGHGLLKFSHSSAIQALAYNPVTQQLASASQTDFGLWSPEVRSVPKKPMPHRVLCAAWSHDGQYLALGCEDGTVSIRDKTGDAHATIKRGAAVWSLAFSPCGTPEQLNVLAVTSWDSTLSFHTVRRYQEPVKPVSNAQYVLCFSAVCWGKSLAAFHPVSSTTVRG